MIPRDGEPRTLGPEEYSSGEVALMPPISAVRSTSFGLPSQHRVTQPTARGRAADAACVVAGGSTIHPVPCPVGAYAPGPREGDTAFRQPILPPSKKNTCRCQKRGASFVRTRDNGREEISKRAATLRFLVAQAEYNHRSVLTGGFFNGGKLDLTPPRKRASGHPHRLGGTAPGGQNTVLQRTLPL